jgi:DeoR/GlpR family transcriptional regulator of sugar metabolism
MLGAERRQRILDYLTSDGKVVAAHLASILEVSHDTIRRDLEELADSGLLQRVHGGALPANPTPVGYLEREQRGSSAKRSLAKAAAQLLRPDSVVFLSGGTTVVELARWVPRHLNATIFTTSAPAAMELATRPSIDLHLIGGRFHKAALETGGPAAVEALLAVRADQCFFGAWALHPEVGVTVGHVDDVPVLKAMIQASTEVVALATAEKLGTAAPFVVVPIADVTHLVTERSADDHVVAPYDRLGLRIVRA